MLDWKLLDKVIRASKKIFLTTHVNPDADGLGSELAAMIIAIQQLRLRNLFQNLAGKKPGLISLDTKIKIISSLYNSIGTQL